MMRSHVKWFAPAFVGEEAEVELVENNNADEDPSDLLWSLF